MIADKDELHAAPIRVLRNARLVLPDRAAVGDLVVRGKSIAALAPAGSARGDEIWDLEGFEVAPGAIDAHTHGGWGIDFARATAAEMAAAAREYARAGTTRLLITLYAAAEKEMLASLAEAARACEMSDAFLGIHLEGPFLARDLRGALPEAGLHPFEARLFERVFGAAAGKLRVMTFAPEAIPAGSLRKIQAHGIALSIGHTGATAEETEGALREGVARATHLCNAMAKLHHRRPGPIVPLLLDRRARVEAIADGEHLDDRVLEMILRLKGDAGVIAVSDSMPL
ncbi:MAG: amidohydrolase family protein, partial [Planctomycetes bacterium]|nr:amidohydrolase family protein [Planctomycetota bacterium]